MSSSPGDGVRRVEIVAVLSLAADLGMGQPLEQGLRGCLVATELGRALGIDAAGMAQTFALSLLRFVGCTADSHTAADFFDDEIVARAVTTPLVHGSPAASMRAMFRFTAGDSRWQRTVTSLNLLAMGWPKFRAGAAAHCEVAKVLAGRLGFDEPTQRGLDFVFERWDGKGFPNRAGGEQIPLPARIVHVAYDAAAYHHTVGRDGVLPVVRDRAGRGYDPAVVDALCRRADDCLGCLDTSSVWEAVLARTPKPQADPVFTGEALDHVLEVVADFADLKSLYTPGHSRAVARLAAQAATDLALPAEEVTGVRRAGLVHDLGRVAVSVHVWDKPGPLNSDEQERARLHPYYTERVIARLDRLSGVGRLASLHHERLDGSGYHRGFTAAGLTLPARILAAADAYQAMTETRAHRPAGSPEVAGATLRAEARAGRLDADAVAAVLGAAGHRVPRERAERPAGLSAREVEVLGLLALGGTTRQIARTLGISVKTADSHIQHIYTKAGVATRAAATLFAVQNGLLPGR